MLSSFLFNCQFRGFWGDNTALSTYALQGKPLFSIRTKPRWKGLFNNPTNMPKKKEAKQQAMNFDQFGKEAEKKGRGKGPIAMEFSGKCLHSVVDSKQTMPAQHR